MFRQTFEKLSPTRFFLARERQRGHTSSNPRQLQIKFQNKNETMKKSMKNYEFTAEKLVSELKLKVSFNRSKSLRHNFVSKISSGVKLTLNK